MRKGGCYVLAAISPSSILLLYVLFLLASLSSDTNKESTMPSGGSDSSQYTKKHTHARTYKHTHRQTYMHVVNQLQGQNK